MSDLKTLVSGIEYKVRTLTSQLESIRKELAQLQQQQSEHEAIIDKQKVMIRQLEEKLIQSHLQQSLGNKEDVKSVKLRINELVREVDRCIALLNK